MTNNQDEIIEKIRALLSKTQEAGASEAEAAAAAAAAERLLARHKLDMRDVEKPRIVWKVTGIRYLDPWARAIATTTAHLYGCAPMIYNQSYTKTTGERSTYASMGYFGTQVSVDLAVSMVTYFMDTVMRMSRSRYKIQREQREYQRGAGERLAMRIWQLVLDQRSAAKTQEGSSDGTSLIVLEQSEAEAWMKENVKTRELSLRGSDVSSQASAEGWRDADGIHIGGQVGGGGGGALRLS